MPSPEAGEVRRPPARCPGTVAGVLKVTWLGHATVVLDVAGRRLVTDPLLRQHNGVLRRRGPAPTVRAWAGADAVLLSHLHHDHAELGSLRRLPGVPVLTGPSNARWLRDKGLHGVGLDTGWYVEPTLFAKVSNDMRIAQEEIFGPVISAIPFEDVEDAVRIANDSTYGLSGSVWTQDADQGLSVAKRIRTGTFNINGFMLEPCAPFGGYKQSGVGREGGPEGLAAYLEDKAINRF